MSEDLLALLMTDDARAVNRRHKAMMKNDTAVTGPASVRVPLEIRAKVACEACGRLLGKGETHKRGSSVHCGSEACLQRLQNWRRFKQGGSELA